VDDFQVCKTANLGDRIQALMYCTRALGWPGLQRKDKAVAYDMLGRMYYGDGQYDAAAQNFEEAIKSDPDNAGPLTGRGLVHLAKQENEKAIADLNAAVRLAPLNPEILLGRAHFYAKSGDYEHADADISEAIRLRPNEIIAYVTRASMYEDGGMFDKSLKDRDFLVDQYHSAISYATRCYTLTLADRMAAAQADCDQALTQTPGLTAALNALGYLYLKLGQDAKALDEFEQVLQKNPRIASAYYGRGLAKLKKGDASGDDDIADAVSLDPDFVLRMRQRGFKQ
jgi:tetratricopeptide (TPR) repeat protein